MARVYDLSPMNRGRRRRSDGTYMGWDEGGWQGAGWIAPLNHGGGHHEMEHIRRKEMELEERERMLEQRERMLQGGYEHRPVGYMAYPRDSYGDDRYYEGYPEMNGGRGGSGGGRGY